MGRTNLNAKENMSPLDAYMKDNNDSNITTVTFSTCLSMIDWVHCWMMRSSCFSNPLNSSSFKSSWKPSISQPPLELWIHTLSCASRLTTTLEPAPWSEIKYPWMFHIHPRRRGIRPSIQQLIHITFFFLFWINICWDWQLKETFHRFMQVFANYSSAYISYLVNVWCLLHLIWSICTQLHMITYMWIYWKAGHFFFEICNIRVGVKV